LSVVTISAIGHGPDVLYGIPRTVTLETNVPAMVFFTLDGSEPTVYSNIYLGPIQMPTDIGVRLRVWAVSGDDQGFLDVTYTSASDLHGPMRRGIENYGGIGKAVDAYNEPTFVIDGYGVSDDGIVNNPIRALDIDPQLMDIQYSRTDSEGIPPGTLLSIGFPDPEVVKKLESTHGPASSPNNNNVFFDPRSLYIVIDGRDGYEDQSVFIINREHAGTMNKAKYGNGSALLNKKPFQSGGAVRQFYDLKTGKAVFYYWDRIDYRWIKSIQQFDSSITSHQNFECF